MMDYDKRWTPGFQGQIPGDRPILFLFPFAGGGASSFAPLTRALGERSAPFEAVSLQLPGHESRIAERPMTDLVELAEACAAGLAPLLDRPYFIYGHSMGSALAFEFVRACVRGRLGAPAAIFLGARSPQHLVAPIEPLHLLPDREFIATISERYQSIPAKVLDNAELLELIVPTMKADFQMLESYAAAPEPLIATEIHTIGAVDDHLVEVSDLPQWDRWTSGNVSTTVLGGGHFFLNTNSAALAETLIDKIMQHGAAGSKTQPGVNYG